VAVLICYGKPLGTLGRGFESLARVDERGEKDRQVVKSYLLVFNRRLES
jgi:hypothetical protein